jgi:hypothetical protein
MTIVVGGDSFIWGSELADSAIPFNNETLEPAQQVISQSTFTALMAKDMGQKYECVAYPGYANSAIRRTVMNACEQTKDISLVVVCWSFSGRYEFRFNYDTEERWANWYSITPWTAIDDVELIKKDFKSDNHIILEHHINNLNRAKRTGVSTFAKAFYQHVGDSGHYQLWNSYTEIIMLQQYLQLKGIPYIFTTVDECLLENYKHWSDESISTLYNQIDLSRWILFPKNRGFYTWARDEKYPFGTTHPLEQAHSDAFNYIKENYYELVAPYYKQN